MSRRPNGKLAGAIPAFRPSRQESRRTLGALSPLCCSYRQAERGGIDRTTAAA